MNHCHPTSIGPARARRRACRLLLAPALTCVLAITPAHGFDHEDAQDGQFWIGTWAAAPQPIQPAARQRFDNQTLRLIVHTSVGGSKVRVRISNVYGDQPLVIGAAHIARRVSGADIDPASDRRLTFGGSASAAVPARAMVVSDPVDLDVPATSDLGVSLFIPGAIAATTAHSLAQQTSYVSNAGDTTAAAKFPTAKAIQSWPFLSGVDVGASSHGAAIVAFGSSLTDGDGTTPDTNGRWPDVLAARLQRGDRQHAEIGVLNAGIIGNRLLFDSPVDAVGGRFGTVLGEAGLIRFDRDVLAQSGARYVVLGLGINDLTFPGSITAATEPVTVERVIAAYRQLIARAHQNGVRIIGTTNPPFENAFLELRAPAKPITFYTPEKERARQAVNRWILTSGEFDDVVDLDAVVRDPRHPTQLLPAYDSGDHLHPNNAGCVAEGNAFPLSLFDHHDAAK